MQRKLLQAELWKADCKNCMIILITIRLEADIWVMFTTAFSLCRLESFRKEKCLKNGLKYKKKKAEEYKFPLQVFLGAAKCMGWPWSKKREPQIHLHCFEYSDFQLLSKGFSKNKQIS